MHPKIKRLAKDICRYRERALLVRLVNFLTLPIYLFLKIQNLIIKLLHAVAKRLDGPSFLQILFPRPNQVRRYLSLPFDLKSSFEEFNKLGVRYSILRWYKDLPNWKPGEDIDILVEDQGFSKIKGFFSYFPKKQPVDVYSVGAHSSWDGLPYYPPHLANKILQNAVKHKGCFLVPNPNDELFVFLYHVVYHKAELSGLPFSKSVSALVHSPEHDYLGILEKMFSESNYEKPALNIQELHLFLTKYGWAPGLDSLRKRAEKREFLKLLLPKGLDLEGGEVIVFVVRENTLNDRKILEGFFSRRYFLFQIVEKIVLTDEESKRASLLIRGGEWGKGPFPKSGGPPKELWVAFDYHPSIRADVGAHPFARNQNARVKEALREEINRNTVWWQRYNPMHSSDDELEAWDYLDAVLPKAQVDSLRDKIERTRTRYSTKNRVEYMIGLRSRAKVELIEENGKRLVKKTFKDGFERFFERERFAHTELCKAHSIIEPALVVGDLSLVFPFVEEIVQGHEARLEHLKKHKNEILKLVKGLYDRGLFLVDFHPLNIRISKDGLRVFDFEFLQKYDQKPGRFEECYEFAGIPNDFKGDFPRGHKGKGRNLKDTWSGVISLEDVRSFKV